MLLESIQIDLRAIWGICFAVIFIKFLNVPSKCISSLSGNFWVRPRKDQISQRPGPVQIGSGLFLTALPHFVLTCLDYISVAIGRRRRKEIHLGLYIHGGANAFKCSNNGLDP